MRWRIAYERFFKKMQGSLKMARLAMPFVLLAASTGIMAGTLANWSIKCDEAYDEVRNSAVVQEIIQQEQDRVEEAFKNGTITMEDYYDSQDYIKSNEFIDDVVKNNTQLKSYEGDLKNAKNSCLYFMLFAIPAFPGLYGLLSLYSSSSEEYGEKGYKRVLRSAKEDFQEAKEIKEQKKVQKEMKEYKEEVL